MKDVKTRLLPEEKRDLLKDELSRNLQKKHALEEKISRQFDRLKRVEISLEKSARETIKEER